MYAVKDLHKRKIEPAGGILPEMINLSEEDISRFLHINDIHDDGFIVEVDESHIISNAVN